MQIQHCIVEGGVLQSAPQLRLVQGLSHDRAKARLQARAALRDCLALELACPEAALHIDNQRNQAPQLWLHGRRLLRPYCSISHGPGLALLAWHDAASVGVDIQAVSDETPRLELQAVAQLFLAPDTAQVLDRIAQNALFFEEFSRAWVMQEARLKCAGLGLVEWSEALEASMAGMCCMALTRLGGHAAAVAWRQRSD